MCWDGEIFVGDGTYTPLVLFWGLPIVSYATSASSLDTQTLPHPRQCADTLGRGDGAIRHGWSL